LVTVQKMLNERGQEVDSCPHPKEKIKVLFSEIADKMDLIRVKEEAAEA
jgi:putative protease